MFKIGDKVVCVNKDGNKNSILTIGNVYVIRGVSGNYIEFEGIGNSSWSDYQFELIVNKNNNMSLIKKFKIATLSKPLKSFVQKGIAEVDGGFTTEGAELFQEFLRTKFQDEFNTEVVSKIEIEKE